LFLLTAVRELFRPQTAVNDTNSWGAGIAIEKEGNQTTFWHSGINPGMQSLFVLSPETDSAVVVMTNSDNGLDFAKKVTQELLEINGKWDIERTDLSKLSS
jgi:CubicO group peptidase (beta-lactamase class C family)